MTIVVILLGKIRKDNYGSTTVFLILSFIVIIALISALITVLRYQAERVNAQRLLNISLENEFSRYYRPLFDDYKLLYYIETNEEAVQADVLTHFEAGQEDISPILKLQPSEFLVAQKYYATEHDAGNVMDQVKTNVKYALADKAVQKIYEKLKDSNSETQSCEQQIDEISNDVKSNEEAALLEGDVLKLVKLVEGITVSGGKISCESCYVKQGINGKVTPVNAGIDSDKVWKAVKKNDQNISKLLNQLIDIAKNSTDGQADFPEIQVSDWTKKLSDIRQVTEKAQSLAESISNRMDEKAIAGCIYDVKGFSDKLKSNLLILDKLIGFGNKDFPQDSNEIADYYNCANECAALLESYHISDLCFDYSTLTSEEVDNPIETSPLNQSGILSLILENVSDISTKAVEEARIYEELIPVNDVDESDPRNETNISESTDDSIDGQVQTEYYDSNAMSKFLKDCSQSVTIDAVTESVLLNTYLEIFLKDYMDDGDKEQKYALDYEKEYIAAGKESDYENLEKTAMKIQMLRTASSFVYLVLDRESSEKAYAVAAALVGFTGMDALIRCVKYLILAVWAYEDACVDTGALLQGKKVSLIKSSVNLKFSEMLMFGHDLIQQKIDKIHNKDGIDYNFYLQMFLASMSRQKRLYRCMDIIQFNIGLRYDNRFSFQHALYGAETELICDKPFAGVFHSKYIYR